MTRGRTEIPHGKRLRDQSSFPAPSLVAQTVSRKRDYCYFSTILSTALDPNSGYRALSLQRVLSENWCRDVALRQLSQLEMRDGVES